jgi:hypothetical protein
MKSAFVCLVVWGGTLCITGLARTAPLHPRYNTSDRSTFCCSQEPFNCLLASRSLPTACQAFFSTQPSIKRSANAQIHLPQPTPTPHRVDIEATLHFYLKQHKTASAVLCRPHPVTHHTQSFTPHSSSPYCLLQLHVTLTRHVYCTPGYVAGTGGSRLAAAVGGGTVGCGPPHAVRR